MRDTLLGYLCSNMVKAAAYLTVSEEFLRPLMKLKRSSNRESFVRDFVLMASMKARRMEIANKRQVQARPV